MGDFFRSLFNTDGFLPRWQCGEWSESLGYTHIIADLITWIAYMGIPFLLVYFVRRRRDVPFPPIFWMFSLFILSCGFVHLLEAVMFWWPAYRLTGAVKILTAVVSLTTLIVAAPFLHRALKLPSTQDLLTRLAHESAARQQSQVALQLSHEQLRLAVSASGVGLWELRLPQVRMTWSDELLQIFGIDQAPSNCRSFFALVQKDDRSSLRKLARRLRREGGRTELRFRIHRGDGSIRHVVCRASGVLGQKGIVEAVTGAALDVTEEEHSRERFHLAVEAAPNAMVMVDGKGHILMVNSETERLFGHPRTDLVGRDVDLLVPERLRGDHADLLRAFLYEPSTLTLNSGRQLTGLRNDGVEFPIEVALNRIQLAEGPAILSAIVDITERKRAEQFAKRHADELERRNRSLNEFAYLVSHDLKAPLRAISLVAEWLKKDHAMALGEDVQMLDTLLARARHMDQMIEGVLEHAKACHSSGFFTVIDVEAIVRKVCTNLSPPEGITIKVHPLPRVSYDQMHMEKILQNLIGNAIQHMGRDTGTIEVGVDDAEEFFSFWVADDGQGIHPRNFERIFSMFQTLKGAYSTSGIGLAIVRTLVDRHGGRTWVESTPGQGSRFHFTILKSTSVERSGEANTTSRGALHESP